LQTYPPTSFHHLSGLFSARPRQCFFAYILPNITRAFASRKWPEASFAEGKTAGVSTSLSYKKTLGNLTKAGWWTGLNIEYLFKQQLSRQFRTTIHGNFSVIVYNYIKIWYN